MNFNLPSILTSEKAPHLSDRYAKISTKTVIDLMEKEGFYVADARADTARRRDPEFIRHVVKFQKVGTGKPETVGEVQPQVLFINSHNGTTQARFLAGMYRFACANGLVVGETLGVATARHNVRDAAAILSQINDSVKATERAIERIERWRGIELPKSKEFDFATRAAILRFGDAQRFSPESLLATRRAEDEGRSLWAIFNRVQENVTKGGQLGAAATGRRLTSSAIKNIGRDVEINRALWDLAESFA